MQPILRDQKLCESQGGRPGLPVPNMISLKVSVIVKQRLKVQLTLLSRIVMATTANRYHPRLSRHEATATRTNLNAINGDACTHVAGLKMQRSADTFRASLSGTFLQTLPELAGLRHWKSTSARAAVEPVTPSAPLSPKDLGTRLWKQHSGEALTRKDEASPPRLTKLVPSRFKRVWF